MIYGIALLLALLAADYFVFRKLGVTRYFIALIIILMILTYIL
jgi:hypothetical protein